MDKVSFTSARECHIDELVANMRQLDRQELTAASGPDLHDTLIKSLAFSYAPGAAFDDKGLMCIFGALPGKLMGDEAAPWLVGTDRLTLHPSALNRGTRSYLGKVRQLFPKLFNYVDARNLPSIRWLRRMGFQIDEPMPFGLAAMPFHRFHMGYD